MGSPDVGITEQAVSVMGWPKGKSRPKRTAAHCAKLSAASKGHRRNLGSKRSVASCRKMSQAQMGKVRTAEHCAKISKALKGIAKPHLLGHTNSQGTGNGHAKLTENEVREVFRRAWKGEYQAFIAECFGISSDHVSQIKTGRCWHHLNLNKDTI